MPRNGSDGTYTLSDTIAPSTLADATELQAIMNDVATALTGSIARDGQSTITGQLKGLVSSNPVYAFNGDADTGLGSDTADEVFIKCGGTKILKLSSAGIDVLSGNMLMAGQRLVPTGTTFGYVGATAPAGYVLGNGGSIGNASSGGTARANADCYELFKLEWNTANQSGGEGQVQDSTGVNVSRGASADADWAANRRILLPDYQDRVERGKSGSTAHGQVAGADTATVAQANLPSVNFNVDIPSGQGNHAHGLNNASALASFVDGGGLGFSGGSKAILAVTVNAATLPALTGTAASGGSGTALDIKNKSIVKTKIIKL